MKTKFSALLAGTPAIVCALALFPSLALAQVPNLINYQGRVVVGTTNFNGPGQFKFALVNAAGTTTFWSNSPDTTPADGQPDSAVSLTVTKGLYSVLLGDTTLGNMAAIPASVFSNPDVRLRVWFNDGTNGSQLLTPDQRLAPAAYLSDGSVSSAKIVSGAVGSTQLAANAVQAGNLAAGSVGSTQLAANAVGSAQIAGGAITGSKLASGELTGTMLDGPLNFSVPGTVSVPISFSPAFGVVPTVTQSPGGWTISALTTTGFTASAAYTPRTVVAPQGTDETTSLALVNGVPAIAYLANSVLGYAFASAADGSGVWTKVTVDSVGFVGFHPYLAVVNGKPAISYSDETNGDLKYAYAPTVDGSGTWTKVTVDSAGFVGEYSSLAVVNGKPAISYSDATNGDLKYAYASTADGSGAWTTLIVESAGSVGAGTSLAVINGRPAIAYRDQGNGDLKYAYASTVDGSGSWTTLTVDAPGDVGRWPSITVVNGRPAIAYGGAGLKYAYASTPDGSGAWTTLTVNAAASGFYNSLAVINGKPAVAYGGSAPGFAYASTVDGSGTWTKVTLDSGAGGNYTSLAVINGKAGVSYGGNATAGIKFALIPDLHWTASAFGTYAGTLRATTLSGSLDTSNLTGTIAPANIADASITSAKIANLGVGTQQLADSGVTAAKIANSAVGSSQLAGLSVDTTKLADGAVTGAKIGSGQVVKSLNALTDAVTLLAGPNIVLSQDAPNRTLTITANGTISGNQSVLSDGSTIVGNGSSIALGVKVPLTLSGSGNNILSVTSSDNNGASFTGGFYGLTATGPVRGVSGTATSGTGVYGQTATSIGVWGNATGSGDGVYGSSSSGDGVHGLSSNAAKSGVWGQSTASGVGVAGSSTGSGTGVVGSSTGSGSGVQGTSTSGSGLRGISTTADGVFGSSGKNGVHGWSTSATDSGVWGDNTGGGVGVSGSSNGAGKSGVWGNNTNGGLGVLGTSDAANGTGVYARGGLFAGYFQGNLGITGAASFGSSERQMLNLWGTQYGLGVQTATMYFRSNDTFAWFQRGQEATNSVFNPGAGGTVLMTLESFTPGTYATSYGKLTVGALQINGGADLAEPFKMSARDIPKGSVMIIDDQNAGGLKLSESSYDRRVAGIISGANGINPGIALHQQGALEGDQNVALSGRVYVQADATNGPIKPGDMLTTSDTPGHAMKATDHDRAQGAIIGKAMSALDEGTGMVLVLVTLQ